MLIPFHSDDLSEEVLDAVRIERDRCKKYHEDKIETLSKIGQWTTLFERFKVSELTARDANRLLNRGGNLSKEEKEKKKILKEITKVQQEVVTEVEQWEFTNQREFLISRKKHH